MIPTIQGHGGQLATLLLCSLLTANCIAESHLISDVIQSNGIGNITLADETALGNTVAERMQRLEALRQEHDNTLVFAVDINEASSGTEKAESQGVAIKSAVLTVTLNGETQTFSQYSTRTRYLLAEGNQSAAERSLYYTLLGRSGSSTLTGGTSTIAADFDATLTFPVSIDLSSASEVTLTVELLKTNSRLGDPELFYDYSNGFEDIAVVDAVDARFLDLEAAGVAEAPGVFDLREDDPSFTQDGYTNEWYAWTAYPSADTYYLVGYEDLFPNLGDYDFNDLIVAYRVEYGIDKYSEVSKLRGEAVLITRGATFNHDWHLRINTPGLSGVITESMFAPTGDGLPPATASAPYFVNRERTFSGPLDLQAFKDTKIIFAPAAGCEFTNTEKDCEAEDKFVQGPKYTFNVALDQGVSFTAAEQPPFDPYLFVHREGDNNNTFAYEVHLPGKALATDRTANGYDASDNANAQFTDENGYPFAMIFSTDWLPLIEGHNISRGYSEFIPFVESSGSANQNWYLNQNAQSIYNTKREDNSNKWHW